MCVLSVYVMVLLLCCGLWLWVVFGLVCVGFCFVWLSLLVIVALLCLDCLDLLVLLELFWFVGVW